MPEPKAFSSSKTRRKCFLCKNESASRWISDSLSMTRESGEPKPSAHFVHKELRLAFPDSSPAHENSTRRHLTEHDSVWGGWVEES